MRETVGGRAVGRPHSPSRRRRDQASPPPANRCSHCANDRGRRLLGLISSVVVPRRPSCRRLTLPLLGFSRWQSSRQLALNWPARCRRQCPGIHQTRQIGHLGQNGCWESPRSCSHGWVYGCWMDSPFTMIRASCAGAHSNPPPILAILAHPKFRSGYHPSVGSDGVPCRARDDAALTDAPLTDALQDMMAAAFLLVPVYPDLIT